MNPWHCYPHLPLAGQAPQFGYKEMNPHEGCSTPFIPEVTIPESHAAEQFRAAIGALYWQARIDGLYDPQALKLLLGQTSAVRQVQLVEWLTAFRRQNLRGPCALLVLRHGGLRSCACKRSACKHCAIDSLGAKGAQPHYCAPASAAREVEFTARRAGRSYMSPKTINYSH